MRASSTLTRWIPTLLTLGGALACADRATAPTTARPAASLAGLARPGAPSAAIRVLAVRDLGTLPPRDSWSDYSYKSEAWRINNAGEIIGASGSSTMQWDWEGYQFTDAHPVLWMGGRTYDLSVWAGGTVGTHRTLVSGISGRGAVTFVQDDGAVLLESVSSGTAWITHLVPQSPCSGVAATDVNDALVTTGFSVCEPEQRAMALWSSPASSVEPRRFSPYHVSRGRMFAGGFAVNDGGDVAGASPGWAAGADVMPTIWFAASYPRIVLDCSPACSRGWARDLNERRWVVGTVTSSTTGRDEAFLWTPTGGSERIPPLAGDTQAAAYGINNWNQVVGYSWSSAGMPRAFVWTRRDGTRPLGYLPGAGASRAFGINDHGKIVGSSGVYSATTPFMTSWFTHAVMWELESPILSLVAGGATTLTDPGNLRVVVLGGRGVDPSGMDPGSSRLGDQVGVDTPPATDGKGSPLAYAKDADGDGVVDLVIEFPVPALVKNGDLMKATTELLLTGTTGQGASAIGAVRLVVQ